MRFKTAEEKETGGLSYFRLHIAHSCDPVCWNGYAALDLLLFAVILHIDLMMHALVTCY